MAGELQQGNDDSIIDYSDAATEADEHETIHSNAAEDADYKITYFEDEEAR